MTIESRWGGARGALLLAIVLLVLQQAVLLAVFPPFLEPDSDSYLGPAEEFYRSGVVRGDYRPPGYPVFIALCFRLFGHSLAAVVFAQHLLGLAVAAVIAAMLAGPAQRLVFLLLYLLDVFYNAYQHVILSDFLFSLSLCLLCFFLQRAGSRDRPRFLAAAGLAAALGVLTKPVLGPFVFVVAAVLLRERRPLGRRALGVALFLPLPLLAAFAGRPTDPVMRAPYAERVNGFAEFPRKDAMREVYEGLLRERQPSRGDMLTPRVAAELRRRGWSDREIEEGFREIFLTSVRRHPVQYAKDSLREAFYFLFAVDNRYLTFIDRIRLPAVRGALAGRLPDSFVTALRTGDLAGAALKLLLFMHPFSWAVVACAGWFLITRRRAIFGDRDGLLMLLFALVGYLLATAALLAHANARYRAAVHPLLLWMAAQVLAPDDPVVGQFGNVERKG